MTKINPDFKSENTGFDLASLTISQDYLANAATKKLITQIPIRKPHRQEFIRTRSGEGWTTAVAVIEVAEDRELFIVAPDIAGQFPEHIKRMMLYTVCNRQGVVSLWPIRLPGAEGKSDSWSESAHAAAQHAAVKWVRISSNMGLGGYEVHVALGNFPDPEWPDLTFENIAEIAFKGRVITTTDHPIIRRLQGYT